MPPISIMLKPSSAICNMQCTYCFYHSLANQRESFSYGYMNTKTLEHAIKKAFEYAEGERVYISFQGGEPLLSGIDFFQTAVEMIIKYNVLGSEVETVIQTNGLLIDEIWSQFFKTNNILIGLSLDGSEHNNSERIDIKGNPTFKKAFKAAKLLQKYDVSFNILTVVTPEVAKNIRTIYNFFTDNGFKFLQFIPCLKPLGDVKNANCLSDKEYGDFLISLFALYLADIQKGQYTSVRQMDNFVLLVQRLPANQCGMNGHCTHQYVIEGDGTVFPCDFYCIDQYKMGNIRDSNFNQLSKSTIALDFVNESLLLKEECKNCAFYTLCRGGCKRESLDVEKCNAYKRFFSIALPHLINIS